MLGLGLGLASTPVRNSVATGGGVAPQRRLSAAVGTFALNGEVMSPVVNHKLTASVGAFTLSGVAATLTQAGGGGSTTTFNPSDKAALTTLSGGNLIATRAAGGDAYSNVRSTTSKTGNGKFVIKVTGVNAQALDSSGIGLAIAAASLTDYGGNDANSILLYNDGSVWYNGSSLTGLLAPNETDGWVSFELLTSTILIHRSTDGSTWASTEAITRPSGALFVILGQFVAGDTTTINFAPTGWTLSGATTWD